MARTDTLTNFLTDVASAIKTKKGDQTDILASDFDTEIANLPSGGSTLYKPKFISFYNYKGNSLDTEIANLDTSLITSMSYMLYGCNSLTALDLSNFDVSNVTDMSYMFSGCTALTSIDIDGWNTSSLTGSGMVRMFNGCSNLESIDLTNLSTINVTDMQYMFYNCKKLYLNNSTEGADFSSFNTSNVENMQNMFNNSGVAINIDLTSFDTGKCTNFSNMFSYCLATTIDLSSFDFSKATTLQNMVSNCTNLRSITFPSTKKDCPSLTITGSFLSGCSNINTTVDLSCLGETASTTFSSMFSGLQKCPEILVPNLSTTATNTVNCSNMFSYCKVLTKLDMRSFDFTKITNSNSMFGSSASIGVPNACEIIVADATQKAWINSNFSRLTNVKTVAEL